MPADGTFSHPFNYHWFGTLPEPLSGLAELAADLRWTWSHAGDDLWNELDSEIWQRTQNPYAVLQSIPRQRLEKLSGDDRFCRRLQEILEERQRYLARPGWFDAGETKAATFGSGGIAYFSMEFGIGEALPLYAGGLGILAGDYLKSASDLKVPVTGVGLLYQQGYFRQMLDSEGWQQEFYPVNDPGSLPVEPVYRDTGEWLQIMIDLPGRQLILKLWQAKVGSVRLLLLDSNHPLNTPVDRGITSQLYGGSEEVRLLQEIVLGVGGWRALEALNLDVEVCHLNEGHAAFVVLERARSFMRKHEVSAEVAWAATRAGNVFTTHTPVAAAFDRFDPGLIREYGVPILRDTGISMETLLSLGRLHQDADDAPFNMAYLAMRGSLWANGVSRLHGEVSRRLFAPLFARWPEPEVPIGYVTNGVHVPSWDSAWADKLWTEAAGKDRWLGDTGQLGDSINQVSEESLWAFRCQQRKDLVNYARRRFSYECSLKGSAVCDPEVARCVLDPGVLTLGFARRFTNYKRPNLLLRQPERLARLLKNSEHPVQIVIAGKAHPRDREGKKMLQQWAQFVRRDDIRGRAVLLEDYDISLAQELVQGVDVWVNTPRRPWEACGTSGMKVLVNGGLNLSELDGWWAEAYRPGVGWAVGDGHSEDVSIEDEHETEQLFSLLEQEIIPAFYERDAEGLPQRWIGYMRESMAELAPAFSANRMVREYVEQMYVPAAELYRERCQHQCRSAINILEWQQRLGRFWYEQHIATPQVRVNGDGYDVDVVAFHGDLDPGEAGVELYAEPPCPGMPAEVIRLQRTRTVPGEINASHYHCKLPDSRPLAHYTLRIVPLSEAARIPQEMPRILWGMSLNQAAHPVAAAEMG